MIMDRLDSSQESDDFILTPDSPEASQAFAISDQSESLSIGYLGDEEDSNTQTLLDDIKFFGTPTKSLGEGKSDESGKVTIISISSSESESPVAENSHKDLMELLSLSSETETESCEESQEISEMDAVGVAGLFDSSHLEEGEEFSLKQNPTEIPTKESVKRKLFSSQSQSQSQSQEQSLLEREEEMINIDDEENLPSTDELLFMPELEAKDAKVEEEILRNPKLPKVPRSESKKMLEEKALLKELTRPALRSLFYDNLEYLENIRCGKYQTSRHLSFHKNPWTRQALEHSMITHPFSTEQVDWTYQEMSKMWLETSKDFHDTSDYIWKVLMPECFIKFYMDFFSLSRGEAETRIREAGDDDE